jgi:hypothetical protein
MNPPSDPDACRQAILEHLRPALAVNAVARLDDAIERVVAARRA